VNTSVFQVAAAKEGSDIRIINEPLQGSSVFLVETGEESALSSLRVELLVKERMAYGVEFTSFSSDVRKF
jgi:hypothetical protein